MQRLAREPGSEVLKDFHVSRETIAKLQIYVDLLNRWQKMMNLVSPATIDQVWLRHIADSIQIYNLAPQVKSWADLGSGAGFPGLVTAIRLSEIEAGNVILLESDKRKCSFLREVIRYTGARAEVVCGRIEIELSHLDVPVEAFSARALAPLNVLLDYVGNHLQNGATAFFLKGKDASKELTQVPNLSRFSYKSWPNRVHVDGSILEFGIAPGLKNENG